MSRFLLLDHYFNKVTLKEILKDCGFDRGLGILQKLGVLQGDFDKASGTYRKTQVRVVSGKSERLYAINYRTLLDKLEN